MRLVRDLIIGVVTSIISAGILVGGSRLLGFVTRTETFLEVSDAPQQFGKLSVHRVRATNASEFAFAPVNFAGTTTGGRILVVAIASPRERRELITTSQPVWSGVIGKGEQIELIVLIENGQLSGDLTQQFTGIYTVIGGSGLPEKHPLVVRSASDAQLARYIFTAKLTGLGVGVLAIVMLVLWYTRKKRVD